MIDIKADNFLANLSTGKSKVGDIKLGDLGDSVPEKCSYERWEGRVCAAKIA